MPSYIATEGILVHGVHCDPGQAVELTTDEAASLLPTGRIVEAPTKAAAPKAENPAEVEDETEAEALPVKVERASAKK